MDDHYKIAATPIGDEPLKIWAVIMHGLHADEFLSESVAREAMEDGDELRAVELESLWFLGKSGGLTTYGQALCRAMDMLGTEYNWHGTEDALAERAARATA